MPIYEYACPACGRDFEKLVRMNADAPPCPSCGSGDVKKKVTAAAFQLKGGGWYSDHYGLKSGGGKSEASSASSGDSGACGAGGCGAGACATPVGEA